MGRTARTGPIGAVIVLTVLALVAAPAAWGLDADLERAAAPAGPSAVAAAPDEAVAAGRWLVTLDRAVETTALASDVGAEVVGEPVTSRVQVLSFPDRTARVGGLRRLEARADVLAVEADGEVEASLLPDPGWWHLANTGQAVTGTLGRPHIDVGAVSAWRHADGEGVVIALIDSGVDIEHPHLRDQLWVNPRGGPDLHGKNLVGDGDELSHGSEADRHGTHVAGILVGAVDEGLGISGVAPGARLMVLRFMDGERGSVSHAIQAVQWATANGADVINASWTTSRPIVALRTALVESGLPVVVAAGNSGRPLEQEPSYPAAWGLPNVISVAAVDHRGGLASFSATSAGIVDVGAPGVAIRSTVPGGGFGLASGTSQAAPIVTGAVALALQHQRDLAPDQLAEQVRRSVRPLAAVAETRAGGIVRAPGLLDATGTAIRTCPDTAPIGLADVPADAAHARGIACLLRTEVARARTATTFAPSGRLTRAQTATLLAGVLRRAGALPPPPEIGRFADVPPGAVHRDNIETLAALGLISGRSTSRFDPTATTTRAEFAALAVRVVEHLAAGPARVGTGVSFPDASGHTHERRIQQAATARILHGLPDGRFAPDRSLRRDQAASMLTGLLDRLLHHGLSPAA
jgi:subtilisin family serine protease